MKATNKQIGKNNNSKYIIEINRDLCIGATTCTAVASKTFKMDKENKAVILKGKWDNDESILAAAQSCPVLAITIKLAKNGKQIFPKKN